MEVDIKGMKMDRKKASGDAWHGRGLCWRLGLEEFLKEKMSAGREEIPWPVMALVLVIRRLCDPSSEWHLGEHSLAGEELGELLGVSDEKINDDRLYRALDRLLPHKGALEEHLKENLR